MMRSNSPRVTLISSISAILGGISGNEQMNCAGLALTRRIVSPGLALDRDANQHGAPDRETALALLALDI